MSVAAAVIALWLYKVEEALDELALCGPQLGRPLVDRIHGSKIHNLKELRPRVPGTAEVRLLFVFDAQREAIVLVAGDKAEHGKVTEVDAIRGYVEALGGTVDVVAKVGDWTVRVA